MNKLQEPEHRERCGYAIIAGLHFLAFVLIGSGTPSDAWRAVCALGCVMFLMAAMMFPAEAVDAARRDEDDEK